MARPGEKKPSRGDLPPDEQDPFAAEIAKRIGALVSKEQRSQIVAQLVSLYQERFSGPIAHPRHLREYEDIQPGAADRIIRMAEESLEHKKKMQERALEADVQDQIAGRRYGFAALALLIICALVSGLTEHEVLAGAFLGAGAIGTIGAFIKGRMGNNG